MRNASPTPTHFKTFLPREHFIPYLSLIDIEWESNNIPVSCIAISSLLCRIGFDSRNSSSVGGGRDCRVWTILSLMYVDIRGICSVHTTYYILRNVPGRGGRALMALRIPGPAEEQTECMETIDHSHLCFILYPLGCAL